ncbi:MAG: NAD(P)/FAD-dependent oxidoreductase [Nitrososphaerota archaeon]|nr:NAD(P)/FAD-dependent oxidoreductase [Nitrososphaerota archaeon]
MATKVLVLGGGAGGAVAANRLTKWGKGEIEVTVVDQNTFHEFRPSYLWVSTGYREPEEARRPLSLLEKRGIKYVNDRVEKIDTANRSVRTANNNELKYDYLITSLGSELKTDGYAFGDVPAPWELDLALKLKEKLKDFRGGKVVIGPHSWPYRCPPAPFELAFMLKYLSEQRGYESEITVFHPWSKPMEPFGPLMQTLFAQMLEKYKINWVPQFNISSIDVKAKKITSTKGDALIYDLGIVIPPHSPPKCVADSDLANSKNGYMDVEPKSLKSKKYDDVYGIGDLIAPNLGIGMAGVFAHLQAEHVATRIVDEVNGVFMGEHYSMVGSCVMDLGYMGAAVFCDFSDKILGKAQYPKCWMLGGMPLFRGAKIAFERMWFAQLFGR